VTGAKGAFDVSKKSRTGQLKRRDISNPRGRIFRAADLSPATFFRCDCKIGDAFVVNSFAKLYFIRARPFLLPLHQRVISLPFPN
jgi:hypothetical protein